VVRVLLQPGFADLAADAAATESGWLLATEVKGGIMTATYSRAERA